MEEEKEETVGLIPYRMKTGQTHAPEIVVARLIRRMQSGATFTSFALQALALSRGLEPREARTAAMRLVQKARSLDLLEKLGPDAQRGHVTWRWKTP